MTKRFGFTLAEVLITLGIIGVVAAMSIPTLIANTNSAKFKSQFKKTVATLNQAALMSQAQYDFDYATATTATTVEAGEGEDNPLDPNKTSSIGAMLSGTLAGVSVSLTSPYPSGDADDITGAPDSLAYARLADGSLFVFNSAAITSGCSVETGTAPSSYLGTLQSTGCAGWIDVNGATKPNAEVNCKEEDQATAVYADDSKECTVPNDASHVKDIFPVVYHDGVVEPMTYAARVLLTKAK